MPPAAFWRLRRLNFSARLWIVAPLSALKRISAGWGQDKLGGEEFEGADHACAWRRQQGL